MSMAEEHKEQVSLKLIVEEEKRVVFAECDKDFVDILFSFMTVPIGTIIRLAGKQSKLGSLPYLYQSVEDLHLQFLQTDSCKTMLLHPYIPLEEELHKKLVVKIKDAEPPQYYKCPCNHPRNVSVLKGTQSPCCRQEMTQKVTREVPSDARNGDGVFVEGRMRYMVSCDLKVCLLSSNAIVQLLGELGIRDGTALEDRVVNVGEEEVFNLLMCMLFSKTPLADAFLGVQDKRKFVDNDSKQITLSPIDRDTDTRCKKMSMKLLVRKSSNKVLYAEAREEFTEFLFTFLTFPLGTISKCLGECTSMGCVDNLYKSIKDFSMLQGMKSDYLKGLLTGPKLPSHFRSKNQLLQIEAEGPSFVSLNRTYHSSVIELGGAFLKGPAVFIITNELAVEPLTFKSSISLLRRFNIPMSDIEERVVNVGEEEAISLLKASLVSTTVLSDVFSSSEEKPLKRWIANNVKAEI